MSSPAAAGRVVLRCDGGERIGAGHVARCLPLADALARLGWEAIFIGRYDGLAALLLGRAGYVSRPPAAGHACGVDAARCELAVVDSYEISAAEICSLAGSVALATIAEGNRCANRGVLLDYHLDCADAQTDTLLAGARFAPLDPNLAGAARAGERVERVLVALGGSRRGAELLEAVVAIAARAFPDAEVVFASGGGAESETNVGELTGAVRLDAQASLAETVGEIDLAIAAAGLTAYELACAGAPQAALAIAANQRRTVAGLRARELALCLDLTAGDSLRELPALLHSLADPELRRRLSQRGIQNLDGRGAERAALALSKLFGTAGAGGRRCASLVGG